MTCIDIRRFMPEPLVSGPVSLTITRSLSPSLRRNPCWPGWAHLLWTPTPIPTLHLIKQRTSVILYETRSNSCCCLAWVSDWRLYLLMPGFAWLWVLHLSEPAFMHPSFPSPYSITAEQGHRTVGCNAFTSFNCRISDLRTFCFIEQNRIELARCKVYATSISSLGLVFLATCGQKDLYVTPFTNLWVERKSDTLDQFSGLMFLCSLLCNKAIRYGV